MLRDIPHHQLAILVYLAPAPETCEILSITSLNSLNPVGVSEYSVPSVLSPGETLTPRLTLAQRDQSPDWNESGGSDNIWAWIVVRIWGGFGAIFLLFVTASL